MCNAGTHERHCIFSTNDGNLRNVRSRSQRNHHFGTLSAGVLWTDSEEVEGFEGIIQARRLLSIEPVSQLPPYLAFSLGRHWLVPHASQSVNSVPIPFFICNRETNSMLVKRLCNFHYLPAWLRLGFTIHREDLVYLSKFAVNSALFR